jgi:iron complex transport system substrate-binding protein
MRLKKHLIPILICILGCMLLVAGCGENDSSKEKEPKSKTITITDTAGRTVELPQPLEKVVVINRNAYEVMCILKAQDKVIGVSDAILNHIYLGMRGNDSVGKAFQPSYEKIVELKPQVVIAYASMGAGLEIAEKLEPTGIKVVLLDSYKPETYDSDLKVLGKMFGKEKEANAFLKWKTEQIATLDKVKNLKKEQRVNVFSMNTGDFEKEKWSTFASGTPAHQAIEMAGGINVARELKDYPDISPEWILQHNPEVLVFRDFNSDLLGFKTNDYTNAKNFTEKVIKSNVLSKTGAVQKDRMYIIIGDILGGDKSYLGALYLAKWFYPDLFKDLDPEKALRDYFGKWLEIPFQGQWAYPPPSK